VICSSLQGLSRKRKCVFSKTVTVNDEELPNDLGYRFDECVFECNRSRDLVTSGE
jgi:hypothetical protein